MIAGEHPLIKRYETLLQTERWLKRRVMARDGHPMHKLNYYLQHPLAQILDEILTNLERLLPDWYEIDEADPLMENDYVDL